MLDWQKKTYVMGIINLTPDSFSGDGLFLEKNMVRLAVDQARLFLQQGADILDIGGESTRPGAELVGIQDEMDRVIPVIEAIRMEFPDALISIDSYKALVAEAALKAGANWLNDVWGAKADEDMAFVAARYEAPIILMHNRSQPGSADLQEKLGGRYIGIEYQDLLSDVKRELLESVDIVRKAGVKAENIILDPGIGFGKTVEQNLILLNRLHEIKTLGYPVLLGPSRKSFIGYTLNLPPEERLPGTAASIAIGIARGADIVRVHDVAFISRLSRMSDAIIGKK
jgi:dihydropteroate synthase